MIDIRLAGYSTFLHKKGSTCSNGVRRGLLVFYLEKYNYCMSVEHVSELFDIMWIRFRAEVDVYLCFFYAPGAHHPAELREAFFTQLSNSYAKYSSEGLIFLLSDANTRMGSYLGDVGVDGSYITNLNEPLLSGFLEFSGLFMLNKLYTYGQPTYEIMGEKKFIIDICISWFRCSRLEF